MNPIKNWFRNLAAKICCGGECCKTGECCSADRNKPAAASSCCGK